MPPRPKKNRTLRTQVSEALKAVMRVLRMPIGELVRRILAVRDASPARACAGDAPAVEGRESPSLVLARCVTEPRREVRQPSLEEAN